MFSLIPWKQGNGKRNQDGGALTPLAGPQWMTQMREDFDRLFGRFFTGWPDLWQGWEGRSGLNLEETEDAYLVHIEAPGFDAEDLDLQIRGEQLILKATKKTSPDAEKGESQTWGAAELYREVTLPGGVDASKVEAKYRNGVLTVSLPRTEESKGRRIAIKE